MWPPKHARVRLNLTDGSIFSGTVRAAGRGRYRLQNVQVHTEHGSHAAAGELLVHDRHVLFIQVMPIEPSGDE